MMPGTLHPLRAGGWRVVAATDTGRVRRRNEDAFSVLSGVRFANQDVDAFAVFDGLGGEPRGLEAAAAAQTHLEACLRSANAIDDVLPALDLLVDASGGMTTAAIGVFPRARPGWGWILTAGDSGAYHAVRGRATLMFEKDNVGGVITSCLGGGTLTAHSTPVQFAPGQTFLFCTDGVDEVVGRSRLLPILMAPPQSLEQAVYDLFAEIERLGAPDNATLVAAHWAP